MVCSNNLANGLYESIKCGKRDGQRKDELVIGLIYRKTASLKNDYTILDAALLTSSNPTEKRTSKAPFAVSSFVSIFGLESFTERNFRLLGSLLTFCSSLSSISAASRLTVAGLSFKTSMELRSDRSISSCKLDLLHSHYLYGTYVDTHSLGLFLPESESGRSLTCDVVPAVASDDGAVYTQHDQSGDPSNAELLSKAAERYLR